MKYYLSLAILLISFKAFSQETAKPLMNTEITRHVSIMDIEGKEYKNVKVTLKSTSPDYIISDYYKVKVAIENSEGQRIWKKTLKNVYLYVFSNGQIQVGQQNFYKILIENISGSFYGMIRENEGIY